MIDEQPPDECTECGFSGIEWNHDDAVNTLVLTPQLIGLWADGVQPGRRNERPEPTMWSASEYVDHIRETLFGMRFLVERLRGLSADERQRAAVIGGRLHTVGWSAVHAVHDLWHHMTDLHRIAVTLSGPRPDQHGSVDRINASNGGVPKLPVDRAEVSRSGLVGDRQRVRRHHGRPWQALCLWSGDVIDALVAEGHPLHPGAAGENLTIRGVEWSDLRAGTTVEIGSVRARLSAPAVPCAKNNQWFADGDSRRIDHDRHPGWSRWYASVLETGTVETGAPVTFIECSE